jgi:TolB-like protein
MTGQDPDSARPADQPDDGGAAHERAHAEQRTAPGTVLGTVAYVPRAAAGRTGDTAPDIFGAVLYEMLADRKAFLRLGRRDDAAILTQDPPDLPRSDVHASAAAEVVRHCLEKDAGRRFQSARDLIFNLQQMLGAPAREHPEPAGRGGPSIAVLPFRNVSADPENEFFADGITDDVIANLSKIRSLKVISRTSAMAFKHRDQPLREIGQTLGTRTILEGSVRRAGNRARVVAHLVDARTDEQLWAGTYDRELTDISRSRPTWRQIVGRLQAELPPTRRPGCRRSRRTTSTPTSPPPGASPSTNDGGGAGRR